MYGTRKGRAGAPPPLRPIAAFDPHGGGCGHACSGVFRSVLRGEASYRTGPIPPLDLDLYLCFCVMAFKGPSSTGGTKPENVIPASRETSP